jgi:hypothetical protein
MEKCASNDFYTFLEVEYENIRYYFCISLKKKIKIGIELHISIFISSWHLSLRICQCKFRLI